MLCEGSPVPQRKRDSGTAHSFSIIKDLRSLCPRSSVWIERGSPKAGVVGSNPTGGVFSDVGSETVLPLF